MDQATARRYDLSVSGTIEGTSDVGPRLTVPPTAEERLAELKAERERERTAIRDLEARLRQADEGQALLNERGRFRGMIPLEFFLGVMFVIVFFALVHGSGRRRAGSFAARSGSWSSARWRPSDGSSNSRPSWRTCAFVASP